MKGIDIHEDDIVRTIKNLDEIKFMAKIKSSIKTNL